MFDDLFFLFLCVLFVCVVCSLLISGSLFPAAEILASSDVTSSIYSTSERGQRILGNVKSVLVFEI